MSIFKKSSKKGINEFEPEKAFIEIENHQHNPDFLVLDVRTPKEYQKEHLKNAQLLNVKSSNFEDELEKMDKNKKYFIYCKTGRRGSKAVELMQKHGYKKVFNISGGINKWKSKGLPVA